MARAWVTAFIRCSFCYIDYFIDYHERSNWSTKQGIFDAGVIRMRLIAAFFTLLMLAATVLAGVELSAALAAPTPRAAPAIVARAVAEIGTGINESATTLAWPALFGSPEPPAPPPSTPAPVVAEEKQPPTPPKPPLSSLGYELKGVIRAGDAIWGLVSHPTGDQILRVGDALTGGMVIARIDEKGLWVDVDADQPELLGFLE